MHGTYFEPKVSLELALIYGLNEDEYKGILEILGRTPSYTELGIFSVMWSEHCSYKNSIELLKTLPRSGGRLLVNAGEENAGLVDIGDGLAVVFKIESHNHPSAVEPYQGAATGVGGIMRDIFSMGARPIAALNSLRFGDLNDDRVKYLFNGVVRGIGDYGNSFGVPTVAGEVYFGKSYQQNPIVNAMAVGIVKYDKIARAVAKEEGNHVMIVGALTGRDGIHGATFASEEISENSETKRPSVQVGDPFTEKLLLEAILEAIKTSYIIGIQDMGAAGITCSTSEMSARGKSGMLIDLNKVPVREEKMTSYEIMLSESQERMLLIVKKGFDKKIKEIFNKWDLHAEVIGMVTNEKMLKVRMNGKIVVEIPAESLVLSGGAPVYHPKSEKPKYLKHLQAFDPNQLYEPKDCNEVLLRLLSSLNIASKKWVFGQYDTMVRTNTIVLPGSDAAIVRIKETSKALAMKTDCNARYVYLNPRRGASIAVAECARNIVCSGGKPLAITNCLNFGNPHKPEIFWQFKEAIQGISEACRILDTPVTGGNVSFYNENPKGAIYPTPVIGMIGLIEDLYNVTMAGFKSKGDLVALIGETKGELGGSEYLSCVHGKVAGDAPAIDLLFEKRMHGALLEAINRRVIHSAHDVSEGGLSVCLAECCIIDENNLIGAEVLLYDELRKDFLYFGEDQSRVIVSLAPKDLQILETIMTNYQVPIKVIGKIGGDKLKINNNIALPLNQLYDKYHNSIMRLISETQYADLI